MRKTLIFGTLIALFGAGALAQANDDATTERSATETIQPAAPVIRGEEHARRHHLASHEERQVARRGGRNHDDETRKHHDEDHGRHR